MVMTGLGLITEFTRAWGPERGRSAGGTASGDSRIGKMAQGGIHTLTYLEKYVEGACVDPPPASIRFPAL